MARSSIRAALAEYYLAPWSALKRGKPGEDRMLFAFLSALLWFMSLALVAMFAALGVFIADFTGRPAERMEGIVVTRTWRAAPASVTAAAVVMPNGQMGTTIVPTTDPERYEVCLQLEGQQPCATVRPAHFELLQPGSQVAALARRGRFTGWIRIVRVLDRGE